MQINTFDNHLHSEHSFDAKDSVTALCRAAVRAGLTGIAITDHCDFGPSRPEDWRQRLDGSTLDARRAQEDFRNQLRVSIGIELGQPLAELSLAREALRCARYDVVLCSLHNLSDQADFYDLGSCDLDPRALLTQYFQELMQLVTWGGFDILSHITYPYRYLRGAVPPIEEFEEPLREIFETLAWRGQALELNTSGCNATPPGPMMPELWVLRLFRECGGELVALGSDAHCAAHVGGGIAQGIDLLRAAGFEHQAFFRHRTPTMVKIF